MMSITCPLTWTTLQQSGEGLQVFQVKDMFFYKSISGGLYSRGLVYGFHDPACRS